MDVIRFTEPVPDPHGGPPLPGVDVSGVSRKWMDMPYATRSDSQRLNLFLPETGPGPFPTLIFFHGGAFWGGARGDFQSSYALPGIFRGYAVASVDYRLSGEAQFPLPVHDAKAAVRFLRENADRLALDPGRFAVMGNSAGAYLAAMVAMTPGIGALEDLSPGCPGADTSVRAMVGLFGVYDLEAQSRYTEQARSNPDPAVPKLENFADQFFGVSCIKHPQLARLAWPGSYVTEHCPPILLSAGTDDEIVPSASAADLVDRVNAVCGPGRAELHWCQGAMHGAEEYSSRRHEDMVFSFLDKYMK